MHLQPQPELTSWCGRRGQLNFGAALQDVIVKICCVPVYILECNATYGDGGFEMETINCMTERRLDRNDVTRTIDKTEFDDVQRKIEGHIDLFISRTVQNDKRCGGCVVGSDINNVGHCAGKSRVDFFFCNLDQVSITAIKVSFQPDGIGNLRFGK